MPNIASVLKTEISRIVRKELRSESASTKKAISTYRSQIAELKRQVKALQQAQAKGAKRSARAVKVADASEAPAKVRFSAKGLITQRKRLGLSAVAAGKLLGVSPQSIANWEAGKSRPREKQLAAIAELKKLGKKEVAARLAEPDQS
ncbi:MAG TPA: helix-turn-helix domain-containing protein [Burkholderiaceae bacterium]